ncbi:MAG TPA: glutathione S-transferase family protein [Caulobacteraceae bacterium]|nr:glutathione S-transferase family protein [Caulobacteraceae bacterium]
MILYSQPTSPYSAAVRTAVYAKGLPIEIAPPPGGLQSDEYRAVSGSGTVPCLMLDDGSPLPESTVILAYLDEKFPETPLIPAGPPEARARARLMTRLGVEGVMDPIVGMFHDLSIGAPDARERALERITAGLAKLERFAAAEGFAAGPAFSQADCVLGVALMGVGAFGGTLLGAPDLLTRYPRLAALAGRLAAHPAVARVMGELQAAMAENPLPG